MVDSAAPFTWQGAGASVFGATARGAAGDDDAADDDVERPPDVEFEPIVSLPEVEVVTGEEDETVRRSTRYSFLFRATCGRTHVLTAEMS